MARSNQPARRVRRLLLNGCAVAAILAALPMHAQDVTWSGGAGAWTDAAMLDALSAAGTATITMAATGGETVTVDLSLAGFAAAWRRLGTPMHA